MVEFHNMVSYSSAFQDYDTVFKKQYDFSAN